MTLTSRTSRIIEVTLTGRIFTQPGKRRTQSGRIFYIQTIEW